MPLAPLQFGGMVIFILGTWGDGYDAYLYVNSPAGDGGYQVLYIYTASG